MWKKSYRYMSDIEEGNILDPYGGTPYASEIEEIIRSRSTGIKYNEKEKADNKKKERRKQTEICA